MKKKETWTPVIVRNPTPAMLAKAKKIKIPDYKCIWCGLRPERITGRYVFEGFCEQAPNKMHALPGDVWNLMEKYREALVKISTTPSSRLNARVLATTALEETE